MISKLTDEDRKKRRKEVLVRYRLKHGPRKRTAVQKLRHNELSQIYRYRDIEKTRAKNRECARRYRLNPAIRKRENEKTRIWMNNYYKRDLGYRQRVSNYTKQYSKDHPEKKKTWNRRYSQRNRSKINARYAKWRARNLQRCLEQRRAYYRRRYGQFLSWASERRQKITKALSKLCAIKIDQLKELSKFCNWCGVRLTNQNFSVDHILALCNGGKHEPDNLVACCRTCNSSKNRKLLEDWLPTMRRA